MSGRAELSDFERGRIVGAGIFESNKSEIARRLNHPRTTVITVLQNPQPRSQSLRGRPNKLSDRDRAYLLRLVRKTPKLTYAQLIDGLDFKVSERTIRRMLKNEGIQNWIAKQRPMLTEKHAADRLAFCLKYQDWDYEDWAKVIWSDECSVTRGTGLKPEWVFRTPQQKWDKEMIQPKGKTQDISVMIWCAIWGDQQSDAYLLEPDWEAKKHSYSANSYINVLENNIPGIWEPGLIFMQDNAPIHKVKKTIEWFENNGIEVLDWPPYSPDLNCIEQLWPELKQLVNVVNPQLMTSTSRSAEFLDAMYVTIRRAWASILPERVRGLVDSMTTRINACIEADGWYTRF
jgi:transposase